MTSQISNFSFSSRQSTFFWIGILITLLIGTIAPRSMVFLPGLLGLSLFFAAILKKNAFLKPKKQEIILFGLVTILAFLSGFWSPNPEYSMESALKFMATITPGLLFLAVCRHIRWPEKLPVTFLLIALHIILVLFLASEIMSGHQIIEYVLGREVDIFKLNHSFIVFAVFSLAVLFKVQTLKIAKIKKITSFVFLSLLSFFALYFTESQTAQLTFITGFIFLVSFPVKSDIALKFLAGFVVVFCLILPFPINAIYTNLPEEELSQGLGRQASTMHRFEIWNYAAEKIIENPLYGNGIESMRFMRSSQWMKHQNADSALHAHNAVLQIWVEFGIIGTLLGITLLLYIFKSAYNEKNMDVRRLYLSVFMACFCCSLTGYGVWQSWQVGFFVAMAGMTIALGRLHQQKTV